MLKFIGGILIAFGLLNSSSDKGWLSILSVVLFAVGLFLMINMQIEDAIEGLREELKEEIKDEIRSDF